MKGNGNSRYLKTVGEALSLYPTYEDFLQAMIAGTFPVDFNGINKDGWTQLGTLLNKANLLSDTVISTLGLSTGVNSTPNDAFNVLANIGNVHVWQRVQQNLEAGYELGQGSLTTILSANTNTITALSYYVCDSISVASDGTVSPVSEEKVVINFTSGTAHTGTDALKGKFGRKSQTSSTFYFFPSNCVFTDYVVTKHNIQASNAQLVTGYPAVTTTDYLTSTDPNAYPKQSAEGGQDASYVLGDVVSGYLFASAWDGNSSNYYYSETIKVSDTGTLTQENVKHYTANATNDSWVSNIQSAIRGKFITVSGETNNGGSEGTNLVYIPDDAIVSYFENGVSLGYPYNYGFLVNKMQQVTGYPAIPAGTTIKYLGVLGDKTSIETGSYVGTGTYGESNPNSLTFQFQPKFVVICKELAEANFVVLPYGVKSFITYVGGASDNSSVFTWGEKSLTWYSVRGDTPQLNRAKANYRYVAFG